MKSLTIWLIVIIIAFVQVPSLKSNNPESQLLFSITAGNKARLGVINSHRQTAMLQITNKRGDAFFTKAVTGKNNYFKLLDLAKLPDGNYSVKVEVADAELNKNFIITESKAEVPKQAVRRAPVFKQIENQALVINYSNKFNETVNVFFMQNDDVVFEDRGIKESTVLKKYSLKQLPRGKYMVKLYSGSKIYSHPLEINK